MGRRKCKGHINVYSRGNIYIAVTNIIMKGIVGNSWLVVASIRGRVLINRQDRRDILHMEVARSDNFILKPARKDTLNFFFLNVTFTFVSLLYSSHHKTNALQTR